VFSGSFESVHFILKTVLLIQSGQFTYILQSVLDDHHFETNVIASDSISVHLISSNPTLNPDPNRKYVEAVLSKPRKRHDWTMMSNGMGHSQVFDNLHWKYTLI
jgi:hypothetical protein